MASRHTAYDRPGHFRAHFRARPSFRFLADELERRRPFPRPELNRGSRGRLLQERPSRSCCSCAADEVPARKRCGHDDGLVVLVASRERGSPPSPPPFRAWIPVWADDAVALEIDADAIVAFGCRSGWACERTPRHSSDTRPGPRPARCGAGEVADPHSRDPRTLRSAQCSAHQRRPAQPANAWLLPMPILHALGRGSEGADARPLPTAGVLVPAFDFRYRPGLDEISFVLDEIEESVMATR